MTRLLVALFGLLLASLAQGANSNPGSIHLLAPANNESVADSRPEFSWSQTTPAATWYHLWVQRSTNKWLELWFQGETAWTSPSNFPGGAFTWWVQGWNASGYGPWSGGSRFSVPVAAPSVPSLIYPNQTEVSNATVRYTWSADTNVGWYRLCVVKSNSIIWDEWYCATNSVIDAATGNFAVDVRGHFSGEYRWWVQGWNFDGLGPWSAMGTFTVPKLKLGAVTLLSPSGYQPNTSEVRYNWTPEPNAELYEICLTKNGSIILDEWCYEYYLGKDPRTNCIISRVGHAGGAYQWWVRAWNSDGIGPWSSSLSYHVPVKIPDAPNLIWPYGAVPNGYLTFQWQPVEGAAKYYLTCKGAIKDGWTSLSATTPYSTLEVVNGPLRPGTYSWCVTAWNEDGTGPTSALWHFTVP